MVLIKSKVREYYFYGSEAILSNMFEWNIRYDDKQFNCGEQLFVYLKAKYFGDKNIMEKVLLVENGFEAKKLSRKIKGFNEELWLSARLEIMKEVLRSKFDKRYVYLHNYLRVFYKDGYDFYEASPRDKIWGIGKSIQEVGHINDTIPHKGYEGLNLLGYCIEEVCKEMFKDIEEIRKKNKQCM